MPKITLFIHHFRKCQSFQYFFLLICTFLSLNASPASSFHQDDTPYLLSPETNFELEINTSGQEEISVAIETKPLEKDLQGKIPVQLILDSENLIFENGDQQISWHSQIFTTENAKAVSNSDLIYLKLIIDRNHVDKKIKIRIRKEKDHSRLSAIAAFFPQMIPVILMNDVTWGAKPVAFFHALMRWNYKVLGSDIFKSTRDLVINQYFGEKKPLLAQCSADFIESFLLFEAANYGETSDFIRTRTQTFRAYIMSSPFKRLMDCMSNTVASTLIDIQKNQVDDEWQYLKQMNQTSIRGLSKLMVGYGFNTLAFEAGDFFKSLKKTIGFSNAANDLALQADLDRSIIKATQYTVQSGYEDFFKGQLKYHNFNERYSFPLATGAGVIEILWRLHAQENMTGRDQEHQFHSFIKRAEAVGVSINQALAMPELSDLQLLALGVVIPAVTYFGFNFFSYKVTSPTFKLFDSAYEGMVLGAVTHLIAPILQKYGISATEAVQKQILQYLEAETGSWAEYFLSDTIRYRIDILTENQYHSVKS